MPRFGAMIWLQAVVLAILCLGFCSESWARGGGGGKRGQQDSEPTRDPRPAKPEQQLPDEDGEYEMPQDPLVDVLVEGNRTISDDEIAKRVKTRTGRPPNPKQIKEDVQSLYGTRWFFSVEPRYRRTEKGPVLVFVVQERPILRKVEYKGNKEIKTKDLEGLTGLKVSGAFDVGVNREAARRIESHYQEKSYVFAKVSLEKGDHKDDREVIFKIEEGPCVKVGAIRIDGNSFFSDPLLKTKLKTKTRMLWFFGGKYDPASIPDDIAALKDYYHGLGFFDVKIDHKLTFSKDKSIVEIDYVVTEGMRFKIRNIEFRGLAVLSEAEVLKDMNLHPNDFFTERRLTKDVEKITNQYGKLGRMFAKIDAAPRFLEEPGAMDLVFSINEDEVYRIRRINVHIQGDHPHTKESVVRNKILFAPGDLANPVLMKKSEGRLASAQVFTGKGPSAGGTGTPPHIAVTKGDPMNAARATNIVRAQGVQDEVGPDGQPMITNQFNDPMANSLREPPPNWVDVDVNVSETQTGRLMFGVGVNSNAGLVGSIVLEENNFDISRPPGSFEDIVAGTAWRGGGQQFRVEAVPGTQLSRYSLSWRDPNFLDQDYSLGVSGMYFTRYFPNWYETRKGGRITAGKQLTPEISANIALRLEDVDLTNPSVPTPPSLASALGDHFLSTVRASISHDTRDSPFLAGKGHFVELGYEQGIADYVYPRVDLDARQYFTLAERADGSGRQIFTMSGQFGYMGDNAPIFEKYYAGGFQSFRGFAFYGVTPRTDGVRTGGQFQALGSLEYMVPVVANDMIQFVTFTDFGSVENSVTLNNFRLTVGAGLRLTIPAMGPVPIALDFGVPVIQQSMDTTQIFSFYVGMMR